MTLRSHGFGAAGLASFLFLLAACGSDSGSTGALGQSETSPECDPGDVSCGLDGPIAVGARLPLQISITAPGVAASSIALESTKTNVLAVDGASVKGVKPGFATLTMLDKNAWVIDFLTVSVEEPDRIALFRRKDAGLEPSPLPSRMQIAVGDDFEVSLQAFLGATRLLGDLEATWTVDGSSVRMLDGGRPATRRFRAAAAGTSTINVQSANRAATLVLEVQP
jgi:hypothetical protein